MAQRRATAVRHPLASAASSTPSQLSLGDKTPRTDEELPLGDKTPGMKEDLHPLDSAAKLAAPASLGGRNPGDKFMEEDHSKTKTRPRGNHLQGQRNRPTSRGAVETTKKSFSWGTKPWGHKELPLGDKTPGTTTTTTPNLRGCGRTATTTKQQR